MEKITVSLPGLNCGACGYASCREYAVSVFEGAAELDRCRAGGAELAAKLASIMGKAGVKAGEEMKAVIRCGVRDRKYLARYTGPADCASASLSGGGLACRYGCFGYGDCVSACPSGAITPDPSGPPRIEFSKCTGCGLCVKACPRGVIELRPVDRGRVIYVACSGRQSGKVTRKVCESGCIACRICEKKAPEGAFSVENNLARFNGTDEEIEIAGIKCPADCIRELT